MVSNLISPIYDYLLNINVIAILIQSPYELKVYSCQANKLQLMAGRSGMGVQHPSWVNSNRLKNVVLNVILK